MAAELMALGSVRSLRSLTVVRGFGRRRIANLRAALSRQILPENLRDLLHSLTGTVLRIPEIRFPHPLGDDATFPPLVARRLLLEATTVRGEPMALPGFPFDHPKISHFRTALRRPVPDSVIIIGGGYVGVEIALAWAAGGCRVTIVESRRQLLAGFIPSFAADIQADVLAAGIGVVLEAEAVGWALRGEQIVVFTDSEDGPLSLWADTVLVAVGVREPMDEATAPSPRT
jgi:NADPH-dependent 2,4-dienoyl-CoA reductase/sulfur reductase-like enzyme